MKQLAGCHDIKQLILALYLQVIFVFVFLISVGVVWETWMTLNMQTSWHLRWHCQKYAAAQKHTHLLNDCQRAEANVTSRACSGENLDEVSLEKKDV